MAAEKWFAASWLTIILIGFLVVQGAGTGTAGPLSDAEYHQLMAAARNYVKAHSAPGITFEVKLLKQVRNYALLEARPTGKWKGKAEPAGIISKKISGQWVPQTMGTDFSDWETQVPELFQR